MCMQDLVINRAVTWRTCPNIGSATIGATTYWVLPPSPDRVAAAPVTVAGSAATQFFWQRGQPDPTVMPQDSGAAGGGRYVDIWKYPGIFSMPLYLSQSGGAVVVMEAVLDPELATIVQDGYVDMQSSLRARDGRP